MTRKNSNKADIILRVIEVLLIVFVFIVVILAIGNMKNNKNISGKERMAENIRFTVMECYAAEGKYPPNIKYLEDNYGLQINERYSVKYDIFAENIMPDITVIEKK